MILRRVPKWDGGSRGRDPPPLSKSVATPPSAVGGRRSPRAPRDARPPSRAARTRRGTRLAMIVGLAGGLGAAGFVPALVVAPVADHRAVERGAVAVLGVADAEEVPAGADLGDGVDRQRVVVDDHRIEQRRRPCAAGRRRSPSSRSWPAARPPSSRRRASCRLTPPITAPHSENTLSYAAWASTALAAHTLHAAVRQPVAPGQLAADHRRAHVLGRAERRCAPDCMSTLRREPAVDDRRARAARSG